jgi:hypothetical protein
MEDKAKLDGINWFNQLSEFEKKRLIEDNAEIIWASVAERTLKASFTIGALQALREYQNGKKFQGKHND